MKIKAGLEADYENWCSINNDPYGGEVVRYSRAWADLMEAKMDAGFRLADVAKETSQEADTDGITGFMYGCAVMGLAHFWEYGEALRLWHNLDCQLKDEGVRANETGGVLNPAILNIG